MRKNPITLEPDPEEADLSQSDEAKKLRSENIAANSRMEDAAVQSENAMKRRHREHR